MLGLGTRLFISPESSYGVENAKQYTNNTSDGSADYKDMHTYYIMNDKITTSFNQDNVDYISDHRGRRNVFHKSVNNVSGTFSFNLQHNMLKLFSLITGHQYPNNLWYDVSTDDYKNILSFRTQEIITIPSSGQSLPFTNYFNEPNVDPDTSIIMKTEKPIENPIQSMTLITAGGDYDIEKFYRFYGTCVNSLSISVLENNPVSFTIDFLGQKEELDDFSPHYWGFEYNDIYANIYPSWQAELKLNGTTIPFSDFSLDINNNLEFANFMESDNQYPTKPPFPSLREVIGSFTIEYLDDSYYNYIQDLTNVNLELSLVNGNQEFIITCPTIVFADGGSLNSLPEGTLELNLDFTAINNSDSNIYDYSGSVINNPTETTEYITHSDEISFTIREQ